MPDHRLAVNCSLLEFLSLLHASIYNTNANAFSIQVDDDSFAFVVWRERIGAAYLPDG